MDLNHDQNVAAIRHGIDTLCQRFGLSCDNRDKSAILSLKRKHPQLSNDILLVSYFSSRHMNMMVNRSELANKTGIRTKAVTNYNGETIIATERAGKHGTNPSFFLRNHPQNKSMVMVIPLKGDITLGWYRSDTRSPLKYYRDCGERSDTKALFLHAWVKACWKAVGGKLINLFAFEDWSNGQTDEENNTWLRSDIDISNLTSNPATELLRIRDGLVNRRIQQLQEEADRFLFEGAPLHIQRAEHPNAPDAHTQFNINHFMAAQQRTNDQLTGVMVTQQQHHGEFVSAQQQTNAAQQQTNAQLTSLLADTRQDLRALGAQVNDLGNRHHQDITQVRGAIAETDARVDQNTTEIARNTTDIARLTRLVAEWEPRQAKFEEDLCRPDEETDAAERASLANDLQKMIDMRNKNRNQAAPVPNEDDDSLISLPNISELPPSSLSFLEGKTAILKGDFGELNGGKDRLKEWLKLCGVTDFKDKMFAKCSGKYILIAGTGDLATRGITRAKEIGALWFLLPDFVGTLTPTPNDDAERTLEPGAIVYSTPRRRRRGKDEGAANEVSQQDEDTAGEVPQQDEDEANDADEVPQQDDEANDVDEVPQEDVIDEYYDYDDEMYPISIDSMTYTQMRDRNLV